MATLARIYQDLREEIDRAEPTTRELIIRALEGLLQLAAADNDEEASRAEREEREEVAA